MQNLHQELDAAWSAIDERLQLLQRRHAETGDIPLYDAALSPPATASELKELANCLGMPVPPELEHALRRWNGRWIAHDHMISLSPVQDYIQMAKWPQVEDDPNQTFERVVGPINPTSSLKKRICFGGYEGGGTFLYLDFEPPPPGGRLGQIICFNEEPVAKLVAPSFLEFLRKVAAAPPYDDDPEADPFALGD
jgi:cell wall assembly regulator SMI1